ncbi:division/cell wall cluster transcriptional repressor MraZ [Candidatus Daviesbacteria bacterium RIFCSPLOWO2_01_FULL_39_12]|uniref:Transcriptional regulator MraZ n=1 Tax=Candidatus Daviesbacteria bacterium RIFCSPLOWO2_01_FULL_39_12 TaxID=1797785 RepID=A0A1F5KP21_9BACT|nr:MAG: division/cell wall cluster transcriptional repressor MraZ [Candidatus Daviesbacteria bacterium RIFCSPHIGHO2_02_FULL_39_8]OGE42600.1 MAG: division/cell wall cluster transcriptional repressor MraZ [Candidatus Daviesbacteria bacterium RIFCSPLOWO2_01_FULL_39_12]
MFLGEYQLNFSGKGRIVLPKKIRQEIKGKDLILSRGFENCIWGFSPEEFEKEAKRQLEISATEERARYLRRYLFSGSVPAELDSQGRFVIPSALLTYARIMEEVVIIGAGDHFEVWNKNFWKKHLTEIERDYAKVS